MNKYTLPYTINPKFLPRFWKTEHTEKYISKDKLKLLYKPIRNTTLQTTIPFSQYEIHH